MYNPGHASSIFPKNKLLKFGVICWITKMVQLPQQYIIKVVINVVCCWNINWSINGLFKSDLQSVLRMRETNAYICIYKQI